MSYYMVGSGDIGVRRDKNLLTTLQFLIDGGDYSKGSSFLEKAKKYQATVCALPGHPLHTFRQENDQITKLIEDEILPELKIWQQNGKNEEVFAKMKTNLTRLLAIKNHYSRKEISIYPLLVKYGLASEEQVSKLWQMDEDVHDLVKKANSLVHQKQISDKYVVEALVEKMAYQVLRSVFQEETILMPMLEKVVSTKDWYIIKQDEVEVGYCLIDIPPRWEPTKEEFEKNQLYRDQKSDLNEKIIKAFHQYVSNLSHIDTKITSSDILTGDKAYPIGDSNTGPDLI
ncbi:MAG: hemerythrin domain-containing protein, partial [Lactobacillus sp.]|nr:hemerythrin domain-containing protein [Lactobacillus sp.]